MPLALALFQQYRAHFRIIFLAIIALPILTLTGCRPSSAGRAAISVDEDGSILGIVAVCEDSVDGLMLVHEGADEPDGKWQYRREISESAVLVLAQPGTDWETIVPLANPLDSETRYRLFGGALGNARTIDAATFTLDEIENLEPWKILGSEDNETVEHYLDHACADWGKL